MGYRPESPPENPDGLRKYLFDELNRVSATLDIALARSVEFLSVAPKKPREGMVYGADGTNWNPGGGKGVYVYYSGTWNKL